MQNSNKFVIEEDEQRDEENPKMRNNSSSKKNKSPQKKSQKNRSDAYQIEEYSNDVSKSEKPEEDSQFRVNNDIENHNNDNNNNLQIPNNQNKKSLQASPSNHLHNNQMNAQNNQQDNIQVTKNNYSTEQLKHPPNVQQLSEENNSSPEQNPAPITKLQGIDFTDPKNRQILEDQFFGNAENPRQSAEFDKQQEEKGNMIPKKFQYLAIFLAFSGVILIIVGFIVAFSGSSTKIMKGGAFWTIGAICCIPGIYYSIKIFRSRIAANQEDRLKVANDIPRY